MSGESGEHAAASSQVVPTPPATGDAAGAWRWQAQVFAAVLVAALPTIGSGAAWSSSHSLGEKIEGLVVSQQRLEIKLQKLEDERAAARLEDLERRQRESENQQAARTAEDRARDDRAARLERRLDNLEARPGQK